MLNPNNFPSFFLFSVSGLIMVFGIIDNWPGIETMVGNILAHVKSFFSSRLEV